MKLIQVKIAGWTYETDDASLIQVARQSGPGFSKRIAEREGKIWRIVKDK